jgi:hypothetical protein
LNTQNIFYKFLKLAVILQKGKIVVLEKRETGRSGGRWPSRPRSAACPGLAQPNRYAAVGFRSDCAAVIFPAEACTRACAVCVD